MTDKDLLKLMQQNGWKLVRVQRSHHVIQKGNQTEVIPIHGKDVPTGLLNKILKRAGLK
jgi:predicted RNA binding protein YcfA (HicA-like mRNA interferase family)